jgi:23S rRNA (cytosine1962-C5)-methyltransferase
MIRSIRISQAAARAISAGHPWFLREGADVGATGEVVTLVGPGGPVGWGLADEGPIAVRVLGRRSEPEEIPMLLADRVLRADRARTRLLPGATDAYRLVNGAGDGLPGLVIDRYGDLAVVRVYGAAWVPWLDAVRDAILALGWPSMLGRRLGVERVDGSKGLEHLAGAPIPEALVVSEDGMRMLVRPFVGQKTGLFLDQREHRRLVKGWAAGRIVSNLFAYNGGFSVAAALGGAARVTTVDIAPDAIDDARENFRLNGLDPAAHGFEVADVFSYQPRGRVDFMIVDPPSLTHGRRSDGAARSAYRKLHRRLAPFVSRDGLLATSSCSSRLSLDAWRDLVAEGLGASGSWAWHHVSVEPPDHPCGLVHREARYLKFALLRRLS